MWGHFKSAMRLRDPVSRRDLLQLGVAASLSTLGSSAIAHADPASAPRAKRCIMLFLTGGPPQHDTWDPKPLAPAAIRGETQAIATSVPGIQFGHWFPKVAQRAHQITILRSVTHGDTVHTTAGYSMLTGMPHPNPSNPMGAKTAGPSPNDHPHLGSLLAKARPGNGGIPRFASLPEVIKDAAINEFPGLGGGFLGKRFDPFRIDATADHSRLKTPDIALPIDVPVTRLTQRQSLRGALEDAARHANLSAGALQMNGLKQQAYELLQSRVLHDACDLERETEATCDRYGRHLFGQSCLLARRLAESGVVFTSVYWHYEGPEDSPVWDTHGNNFPHLKNRLAPPTDQAISALLDDLVERGMLEDTLLLCWGEFGRSPKINRQAGRDHWPNVQSIILAGAGLPKGACIGRSDSQGAYPIELAVSPADLAATVLKLLGVSLDLQLHDIHGRPLPACTGSPIPALMQS